MGLSASCSPDGWTSTASTITLRWSHVGLDGQEYTIILSGGDTIYDIAPTTTTRTINVSSVGSYQVYLLLFLGDGYTHTYAIESANVECTIPPPSVPSGWCQPSTSGVESTVTWSWRSPSAQAGYDITYTDPLEHPAGQSLWQDMGSRTGEGPASGLTPGALYAIWVRAKNAVGVSAHAKITCNTPAPDGASQLAEVKKIAHLGSVTGGYTLQQFKSAKNPVDPNNPTNARHPYLAWRDDNCSIPQKALIEDIVGWGDEYIPTFPNLPGNPAVPGAPRAQLKEGCWRHDFAWRNLYRIDRTLAEDSWNETNYNLSNDRLKADWLDICSATYTGGWSIYEQPCRALSTVAWEALRFWTSVEAYSANVEDIGYVQ